MTQAKDVRELIAGYATDSAERKAIQGVADRLEEHLRIPVPSRPGFQDELYARIMREARRTVLPWYRRPSVWGTSVAAAAAVFALAVGLKMFQPDQVQPGVATTNSGTQSQPPRPEGDHTGQHLVKKLTSDLNLPQVAIQDEVVTAGSIVPDAQPADMSAGLKVWTVNGKPDLAQYERMAMGLGFSKHPEVVNGEFRLSEGSRQLAMLTDGRVVYSDLSADPQGTALGDTEAVRLASRNFLDRARLPIPDANPIVTVDDSKKLFKVIYTPQVNGAPVVNAQTTVQVTSQSVVAKVEAFAQGTFEETSARYQAISSTDAIANATTSGGGEFDKAELVYVRTLSGEAIYLQPYWRVYGLTEKGEHIARYVPALVR